MKTIFKVVIIVFISALCTYGSEDMPLLPSRNHIDFSQTLRGRIENGVLIWKIAPSTGSTIADPNLLKVMTQAFQMWEDLADSEVKFKYGGIATQTLQFNVAGILHQEPTENIITCGNIKIGKGCAATCRNGSKYMIFDIKASDDALRTALHEIGHWLGFADIKTGNHIMAQYSTRIVQLGIIEQDNIVKLYNGRAKTIGGKKAPQNALSKKAAPTNLPVYVLKDGRKLTSRTTREDGDSYIITTEDGQQEEVNKSDVIEIKR